MARSGEATKERILDAAEALVFEHGFSATSLDNVLEQAGLTKGAFFYHFKNKAELGAALIARYAARDDAFLEETMQRAEKLSEDPLQQLLIFVGLAAEPFETLAEPAAGCLFASYVYQPLEFTADVADIAKAAVLTWRVRLLEKLEAAAGGRIPEPELRDLADHLSVIFEGAYVIAKVLDEPGLLARQLKLYRRTLELRLAP